jgi:BMFP domain-containing protein YqiC
MAYSVNKALNDNSLKHANSSIVVIMITAHFVPYCSKNAERRFVKWTCLRNAGMHSILLLVFRYKLRYQPHMTNDPIDKLVRALTEVVPQGLRSVSDDLEENFRSVLKSGLSKLDLVTREEFEVQEAVLARTRENLDAMEARLAGLEDTAGRKAKTTGKKKVSKKKASKKK